tara:strand:+ start:571 stop:675 length:105 start_codon:yes stop_codon:yes gene_type:complete
MIQKININPAGIITNDWEYSRVKKNTPFVIDAFL